MNCKFELLSHFAFLIILEMKHDCSLLTKTVIFIVVLSWNIILKFMKVSKGEEIFPLALSLIIKF
jgi:hypothetical protein